ncbi:MAG: hypothetical protein HKN12_10500 [Gemmatimonadetes bacterium]|nr:hypothetical protein [Gemmatimonadota bacterium]
MQFKRWGVLLLTAGLAAGCGDDDNGPAPIIQPEAGPAGGYNVTTGEITYDPAWMEPVLEAVAGGSLLVEELPDEAWMIDPGPRQDRIVTRRNSSLCEGSENSYNVQNRNCYEVREQHHGELRVPQGVCERLNGEICNDLMKALAAEWWIGYQTPELLLISDVTVHDARTVMDVTWDSGFNRMSGFQGMDALVRVAGTAYFRIGSGTTYYPFPFDELMPVTGVQAIDGVRCDHCMAPCESL